MYTKKRPFFLTALSPVHAGSGSDLGIVDLPIQRERHTDYPKIEASGIKGVFRERYREDDSVDKFTSDEMNAIFGPENGDAHQGAIGFMDARILFFPVKSVKGVFAWITCDDALAKFKEIMTLTGNRIEDSNGEIDIFTISTNSITHDSEICITRGAGTGATNTVILEEYPVASVNEDAILKRFARWFAENALCDADHLSYQREEIQKRLLVVDKDIFRYFVTLSTEVIARNKIDPNTGTVSKQGGNLWYEEYLPVESILYSVIMASRPLTSSPPVSLTTADDAFIMKRVTDKWPAIIQIGGNQTIGKGFMKPTLLKEEV